MNDLTQTLRHVPLFAGLADRALLALARSSHVLRLPKGKILFSQMDVAEAVYVVQTGCIALMLSTADGRELVINEMREGDMFGELALVTDQARSTGAIAREASQVISIPRAAFLSELERDPSLMRRVLKTTAERLQNSSERESALAFFDAPTRLARTLLHLDQQANDPGYIICSQEELAQRVGLTRQTVAKTLGQWRRAGWLLTGRGKIVLLDRVALRQQADE